MKLPFNINMDGVSIEFIVTIGILLIAFLVYQQVWRHLHKRSQKTKSLIDTSFLDAIHGPFYYLLIIIGLDVTIPFLPDFVLESMGKTAKHLDLILPVGFSVVLLLIFNRFLSNIQKTIIKIEKNEVLPNAHAWISACKLGRLFSILIFILVLFSLFDIPMAQILAPTAVGALALSFASKDILSNVFGGVMVMCDRPFVVGDYVKIGSTEEGTVRYIGWRMTEVQLQSGRILHVPNGLVTTSTVMNYSEKTHWFIQKEVGLRYQDLDVSGVVAQKIEDWILAHDYTNQRRVSFAKLFNLADSSVTIRVRVYLKSSINTKQWYGFIEELLLQVNKIVLEEGADFAFPTRTVMMEPPSESQGG